MRNVVLPSLVLLASALSGSCASHVPEEEGQVSDSIVASAGAGSGASFVQTPVASGGTTTTPQSGTAGSTAIGGSTAQGGGLDSTPAAAGSLPTASEPAAQPDVAEPTAEPESEAEPGQAEPASNPETQEPESGEPCSDTPPDDRYDCQTWVEYGECESEWFAGSCLASCGMCEGGQSMMSGEPTPEAGEPESTGQLGNDNPFTPISGGSQGWASRYWDCCKPSCSWTGNAQHPIPACDQNDGNPRVDDAARNACEAGGSSFACHSDRPWAHSTTLSYGYAAVKAQGAACGKCYQLQFTGRGEHVPDDPGSVALAGKTMVVAVTNIGGDVQDGQFDIMIPGGGVGAFNACSNQWSVPAEQLGAQYGGFRTACENNGNPKDCVRNMCQEIFGSRGLGDLLDGCLWYVDWFEAANNPQFVYEEIQCPAELSW